MSSPAEKYKTLEGKFVYIPDGNFYGEVREVDFDNGILVLDDVPAFDPAERKIMRRNNVFVPFLNHSIVPITKPELDHFTKRMGSEIAHIDKYVKIGDNYGKLADIGWYAYTLMPSIVNISGKARLEEEREINVPRDRNSVILPANKEELDEIVKQSGIIYELSCLEREHRIKELQK